MLKALANLCRSPVYWFLIFLFTLSLELVALYFQYQLGYGPCVLCIHIRFIVAALMLTSILGMICCGSRLLANLMNIITITLGAVFYQKADEILRIERNEIESSCGFSAGFPDWLPLDQWLPSVFEPWESCGYTPLMWFDFTMAEVLIACSLFVVAMGSLSLLFNIFFGRQNRSLQLFNN